MKKTVLIILHWNGTDYTCDLLRSIAGIRFPYPVWVYDNGSSRDDSEVISAALTGVRVIRCNENYGFAGGVNRAVAFAGKEGFDFAYVINNDTLAQNDFLTPCVEIMTSDSSIAIVGSRVLLPDLKTGQFTRWAYHSSPEEAQTFPNGFLKTRHVLGCGMLLRISTFLAMGGLDERFFCYFEENDYCFRIVKAGLTQGIAAKSLIIHKDKGTDDGIWTRYFYGRNTLLFSRLHDSSYMNCAWVLLHLCVLRGWRDILRGNSQKTAALGHGFADAFRGRFGRRNGAFGKFSGLTWFMILQPLVLLYALCIHPRMHPFREKPIP